MGGIISNSASEGSPDKMGNLTTPRGGTATHAENGLELPSPISSIQEELGELFSENVAAKIWKVAATVLEQQNPPEDFPEYVLRDGPLARKYTLREADFWTCGFFPGSLYALLERSMKFPQSFPSISASGEAAPKDKAQLRSQLLQLSRAWSGPLHPMANRTDTHDMGFIIQPALQRDWELTGNERSLESVLTAAKSLATRFDDKVGAIRSWDQLVTKRHNITSLEDDFLVIIDSMCNLDLLYYAGHHLSDPRLISIATTHAHKLVQTILRPEGTSSVVKNLPLYSTCHVVNFARKTGEIKQKMTAQGYSDPSTWARGQAWAILGYAQTYIWTKEKAFLDAACGLAEYFILRLESSPACVEIKLDTPNQSNGVKTQTTTGRYVPLWDFDAPILDTNRPLRDTSAGVIAANGLLLLHQALTSAGDHKLSRRYLDMALNIVRDTLSLSLARDRVQFKQGNGGEFTAVQVPPPENASEDEQPFDAILMNATANFNEHDRRRYWDHGLVYADYFLIEFGNRLLRLGLV
ncbi:hypothetical protein FQN54_007853 [Arachnomyces sp. PD_36]|nr:hypothetical protein FQN54_007853 [Arachnomyces sp. PD_36]